MQCCVSVVACDRSALLVVDSRVVLFLCRVDVAASISCHSHLRHESCSNE